MRSMHEKGGMAGLQCCSLYSGRLLWQTSLWSHHLPSLPHRPDVHTWWHIWWHIWWHTWWHRCTSRHAQADTHKLTSKVMQLASLQPVMVPKARAHWCQRGCRETCLASTRPHQSWTHSCRGRCKPTSAPPGPRRLQIQLAILITPDCETPPARHHGVITDDGMPWRCAVWVCVWVH